MKIRWCIKNEEDLSALNLVLLPLALCFLHSRSQSSFFTFLSLFNVIFHFHLSYAIDSAPFKPSIFNKSFSKTQVWDSFRSLYHRLIHIFNFMSLGSFIHLSILLCALLCLFLLWSTFFLISFSQLSLMSLFQELCVSFFFFHFRFFSCSFPIKQLMLWVKCPLCMAVSVDSSHSKMIKPQWRQHSQDLLLWKRSHPLPATPIHLTFILTSFSSFQGLSWSGPSLSIIADMRYSM